MDSEKALSACPACASPFPEQSRFCPSCGTSLDISDSPTGTAPRGASPGSPSRGGGRRTPTPTSAHGLAAPGTGERFPPGTVLLGRYRILGLVGRGGMGEVYRADDLKLEQPVALKFLPSGLEASHERLERFFGEVRVARQVSHPAVCRVFDIGEAEGQHFLSMEYVDGENLSSLLRRIGRLPPDKALDIARQVCAGLAAAHEKGVLHRDLKPANVMLDGQGKVRITDFGLAGLAETLRDEDVRSGTPSFMSPEQLQGREVTVRSDVYSLGLLLYELFTGRRAFEGRTVAEITRKHRDETPIEPSAIVPDLVPAVERTILACLEKDPKRRPPSASAVAAMLSGRDPLEAAIAAGDTPSPELVAAAGEADTLRPLAAWASLAAILVAAGLAPLLWHSRVLINVVPAEKSPPVLEDRARELIARLGHAADAADSELGLWVDFDYFRHLRDAGRTPTSWEALGDGEPPVLRFWYRQSPRPLVTSWVTGIVGWTMPPADVSGMAGVVYDLRGRLLEFYAVPPQVDERSDPASEPDWSVLLAEAGLDAANLEAVASHWTPPFYGDTRAAWTGSGSDGSFRVEAAAYRGQPVFFQVVRPWTRPVRMQPYQPDTGQRVTMYLFVALLVVLMGVGAVLARRNLVLGRGDRRGAFRLAAALAAVGIASWLLCAHHVADVGYEMVLLGRGAGAVVLQSAILWLFYLALEPYVRRLRPTVLISWTRLLGGGVGDPVVGRDALIGATWGVLLAAFFAAVQRVPGWLGKPAVWPEDGWLLGLLGLRYLACAVLDLAVGGALLGLAGLLLYLVLRLALRRDLPAALALVAVFAATQAARMEPLWLAVPVGLVVMGSYCFVLLRFGLLAGIVGPFVANCLLTSPLTTDLDAWYATPTLFMVPFVALVGLLAFRATRGGSGPRHYLAGEVPLTRP